MARETMKEILSGVEYDPTPRPKFRDWNTVEYFRDGQKIIRLHHTNIMVYSADGSTVRLYTGGWRTITTKDRLNKLAPGYGRIFQTKGQWFIAPGVPFVEGVELNAETGAIVQFEKLAKKARTLGAKEVRLKGQIEKFVKKIHTIPQLPEPCGGDCWFCLMFDQGMTPAGRTTNTDHLLSHVKSGYLHGSLIVNAMKWAGYRDEGIGLWWHMTNRDKREGTYKPGQSMVARAVRRYLRAQLGLAA